MLKIAIIGKPNVGKTTLFNKLYQKKISITYDKPGITRDKKEEKISLFDLEMMLADTAGFELIKPNLRSSMQNQIINQIFSAIESADLILFMVDGKNGINNEDYQVFNSIRKFNKKIILVVNKFDSKKQAFEIGEFPFYDDIVYISAEHKIGFDDLYYAIKKHIIEDENEEKTEKIEMGIKIAFIGKPNAGKSTIINKILKEERVIVDSIAGTTRDSIYIPFKYKDQKFTLIDTAGIKRKANIKDDIEKMSVDESFKAIELANVCIFMMDIENALDNQDLLLLSQVIKEGRILILVFNKFDKVKSEIREGIIENIKEKIKFSIPEIEGLIFLTCSAINEEDFKILFDTSIELYKNSNIKIKTNKLNNWALNINKFLPKVDNRQLKIKYLSQTHINPMRFTLYMNVSKLNENHLRFIRKEMVREFDILKGLVFRIYIKKQEK